MGPILTIFAHLNKINWALTRQKGRYIDVNTGITNRNQFEMCSSEVCQETIPLQRTDVFNETTLGYPRILVRNVTQVTGFRFFDTMKSSRHMNQHSCTCIPILPCREIIYICKSVFLLHEKKTSWSQTSTHAIVWFCGSTQHHQVCLHAASC